MLITLLIWIIIVVISLGYGLGLDHFLKLTPPSNRILLAFSYSIPVFFLGFILINVLASLLSLLMPLALAAFLIIALPGLFLFFIFCRRNTSAQKPGYPLTGFPRWLFIVGGSVLLLLVLWLTSGAIFHEDTYIYHAQSVHWIESYPAIRGLGNFFIRFAYNSSWFVQGALFSFVWLNGTSYHVLNGLWLVSTSLLLWYEWNWAVQEKKIKLEHWLGLILIPMGIISISTQASAPSTDMPAAYTGWVVGYFSMRGLRGTGNRLEWFTLTGMAAFAVIIKLSIIPIMALPMLMIMFLFWKKQWKQAILLGSWMAIILLPWMVRSVISSGYVVYPVSLTALPVDWLIPRELVDSDAFYIRSYGFNPRASEAEVMRKPYFQRIVYWFYNLTRNQKGLVLLSLSAPIFIVIGGVLNRWRKKDMLTWETALTGFVFFVSQIYWLIVSPNLRFGYVFILFQSALVLGLLAAWAFGFIKQPKSLLGTLPSVLLVCFLILTLVRSLNTNDWRPRMVAPLDYAPRSTYACQIDEGSHTIQCATDYGECGYHPFPCHAWGSDYVRMYGDDFKEGFYLVLPEKP